MQKKFVVVVAVFHHRRIKRFVETFFNFDPGCDYDLYFVHNKFPHKNARENKIEQELKDISNLLFETKNKYDNISIIERTNLGEDMGAYHHAKTLLLDKYEYFFFINELTVIKSNGWLKEFLDIFELMPNVAASGPQICSGMDGYHNEKWCIKSTYWAIRNSVLKNIVWKQPLWRGNHDEISAGWQEMKLIYPQVKNMGMNIYQVGTGFNLMNYVSDDGKECSFPGREGLYE
jgi:hypothetical protein